MKGLKIAIGPTPSFSEDSIFGCGGDLSRALRSMKGMELKKIKADWLFLRWVMSGFSSILSGKFSISPDVARQISAVIGPYSKSEHSDWLFDPVLEQRQKCSIPCVSFTIES